MPNQINSKSTAEAYTALDMLDISAYRDWETDRKSVV